MRNWDWENEAGVGTSLVYGLEDSFFFGRRGREKGGGFFFLVFVRWYLLLFICDSLGWIEMRWVCVVGVGFGWCDCIVLYCTVIVLVLFSFSFLLVLICHFRL